MTWIKICGITNLEDAQVAVEAGADALGFVFYEQSPRRVDRATARRIVGELPSGIERVGVFVDQTFASMEQFAREIGLTGVQLHTSETWSFPERELRRGATAYYRAISVSRCMDREGEFQGATRLQVEGEKNRVDAIFLDSGGAGKLGGTGKPFDWQAVRPLLEFLRSSVPIKRVVVAGGLTPENVAEAMRILKPWGVDVASGVEARPGKKDPDKVRAFVTAVRQAEKST